MTAEERLKAHRERKKKENRYKECSGKWGEPPPLEQYDLTKRVTQNNAFVERLSASPKERRKQDEIKKKVHTALKQYSTATSDGEGPA
eukprot:1396225-Ditylum_brightwellii.AAC.1